MRAYNTAAPGAVGYVDWIVNDQPDSTAKYAPPLYNSANFVNITVNRIVQSAVENFLKPINSTDGYFFHINSYDWIHPPTAPYLDAVPPPPQITGLAAVRGYTSGLIPRDHACLFWDETLSGWKFAYNISGDGTTVGASIPVFTGSLSIDGYLAVGTDPAQSGIIRIPNHNPNDSVIRGRNASNTADVDIVQIDGSNRVKLGSITNPVYVTQELLVGDHITHGLSNVPTAGTIRLQNGDSIYSIDTLGNNLNLIRNVGDTIYIGDSINKGILNSVAATYYHSFLVNGVSFVELGDSFARFSIDANTPIIYQTTTTVGNGQILTIQAQNTTDVSGYGGKLILQSGSGSRNGDISFKTANQTKLTIFSDNAIYPTDNDSIWLNAKSFRFDDALTSPIILQDSTNGVTQNLTVRAQDTSGAVQGGGLVLSSGNGNSGTQPGFIQFELGGINRANIGIDGHGPYFNIGTNPSQDGMIRVPNGIAAIMARNTTNSDDIYLIGSDGYNRVVIGSAADNTIIMGNLEVVGTTTAIDSTVVDIADRIIHLNYTTGIAPIPTLITGVSIQRGSADGITDRDHSAIIWSESDGYWKFASVQNGDDLTLLSNLPMMASTVVVTPSATGTYVAAQSGAFRVPNNTLGSAARNSLNTIDIPVWSTNTSDELLIGSTDFVTNLDGYEVNVTSATTLNLDGYTVHIDAGTILGNSDVIFNSNAQTDHIYLDGSNMNLFINLMGPQAYLKANSRTGAYIDLPGGSSTITQNFAIDGYHVAEQVTGLNISKLCNGSNADALHTHSISTGSIAITVGAYGALTSSPPLDGYIVSMAIETGAGSENFPAYVVNAPTATVSRLIVTCSTPPSPGETVIITVRKNKIDTALTLTLDSSMSAGVVGYVAKNLVDSFSVVEGDWITIRCQTSATCAVENLFVTLKI
jgi:hypothetical protein